MTYQLKYRGIPFTYQSSMPTEAVKEVRFRGRTIVLSSPKTVAAPVKDVQFFGWHTAGLAPA
ncbi:MAG: hypothetical protein AAGC93_26790 [Cyanobacteria bacterium P01_F01_bin.53]